MKATLEAVAGALLCAAIALLVSASASARSPADPVGFGIEAVGQSSYFVFATASDSMVQGALRIRSTSDRDRVVFLRAATARTAATGGLDYGTQGAPPTGAARWIRLQRSKVRLPAGGTIDVPFTARVPAGTSAGDHLAGIVAFRTPPRARPSRNPRFALRFVSRLAIAVQFRVGDTLTRRLELRGAKIDVAPAGATLGLTLASTGNALIGRTTGSVKILQHGRELLRSPIRIDAFAPATSITYPVAWPGRPVQGDYEIRGTLHPEGAAPVRIERTIEFGRKRIEQFRRQTGRPAVETSNTSPALLGLTALLGAVAAGLAVGYVRLRRRV